MFQYLSVSRDVSMGNKRVTMTEPRHHMQHDSVCITVCIFAGNEVLPHRVRVRVTLRLTVSHSVSEFWFRAPSRPHDQMFITV
jgi:hypothetical protein